MAEITLSSTVRNNLLTLQDTAKLMSKTQERLATGLKVGSALDDPTAFFTAQSLNSRAGDLNRLLDDVGLAVQSLKAADDAISSITDLVENVQATARQALRAADQVSTSSVAGTVAIDDATVGGLTGDLEITVGSGATKTTITFGAGNVTYVEELQAELSGLEGGTITIAAGTDFLTIHANDDTETITIGGDAGVLTGLGLTAGTNTPVVTPNGERAAAEGAFNSLLTQIDELAGDAGFNGINLLQSDDLQVLFNESGSSSLTIKGVEFDSAGLGITAVNTGDFQSNTNVQASLGQLDAAMTTLRAQASTFGSNLSVVETRQSFTENLINTLESGAAGLTLADTNEEGANMLALQTRQQLSTISLSLASQADQNVLRLF